MGLVPSKAETSRWVINKRNGNITKEQIPVRKSHSRAAWTRKNCWGHTGDRISEVSCRSAIFFFSLEFYQVLTVTMEEKSPLNFQHRKSDHIELCENILFSALGDAEPEPILRECSLPHQTKWIPVPTPLTHPSLPNGEEGHKPRGKWGYSWEAQATEGQQANHRALAPSTPYP